jgi:hypothetical protein
VVHFIGRLSQSARKGRNVESLACLRWLMASVTANSASPRTAISKKEIDAICSRQIVEALDNRIRKEQRIAT